MLTYGVRALEDPVLPGAQTTEDFGLHGLRSNKSQIGLHADHGIGGIARALFEEKTELVFPIDIIRREGHEPCIEGLLSLQT